MKTEYVVTHAIVKIAEVICLITISAMVGWSAEEQRINNAAGKTPPESIYQGQPLSYWLKSIRERDDNLERAFDAITNLGPDASPAVEELVEIVAEPFTPIRIGVDSTDVIAAKRYSIRTRSGAIDALTAIGEASASSALPLIQWALAVRVIPMKLVTLSDKELFVDLLTIDVLERMRVAGAVARFGPAAAPAVVELLKSSDDEKRKLAVAILSEHTLPIARHLLKSADCDDRNRGIAILGDMWPVLAKEHLAELKKAIVCAAN